MVPLPVKKAQSCAASFASHAATLTCVGRKVTYYTAPHTTSHTTPHITLHLNKNREALRQRKWSRSRRHTHGVLRAAACSAPNLKLTGLTQNLGQL
jgi:hypothetical protein